MSHYSLIKIVCDWPECYAWTECYGSKVTDARKKAAALSGWKNVASLFDFCGTKEQAESHSTDRDSCHGHATREDHQPVIKAAGKGRVELSCLCGWKYVSEYTWEQAGTVYRGSAGFRWGNHMREVLAEAKAASASTSG
jgi:hypothetical protein